MDDNNPVQPVSDQPAELNPAEPATEQPTEENPAPVEGGVATE